MSNTIIKDPVLEPFYISKDQYCYTVMEVITPEEKNLGRFGRKGGNRRGLGKLRIVRKKWRPGPPFSCFPGTTKKSPQRNLQSQRNARWEGYISIFLKVQTQ